MFIDVISVTLYVPIPAVESSSFQTTLVGIRICYVNRREKEGAP